MTDQILHKQSYNVCPHHPNYHIYATKNWQNCAPKGSTVLPEQPISGSQNSSQNCPVLAARTAARAAVLARTVLPKLAAQFRQNKAVLAENNTARTPKLAVHMYQTMLLQYTACINL